MKPVPSLKTACIVTASCVALSACFPEEPGIVIPPTKTSELGITLPHDVKQECVLQSDTLPAEWTKLSVPNSGLPQVGPVYDPNNGLIYIFPPNSPAFTPNSSNSNCSFFKWSAQMFTWLTSSVSDTGAQNPHVPDVNTPFVFNSEFFYRVIPNSDSARKKKYPLALTAQVSGGTLQHAVALRSQKPTDGELADGIDQAGGGGILLSQHYDPQASDLEKSFNESLVYFSGHVNRTYGYFTNQNSGLSGIAFPSTKDETCKTLKTAQTREYIGTDPVSDLLLYSYCGIGAKPSKASVDQEFATAIGNGTIISKLEPAVDYLSMAVELKSSWVDASTIPADARKRYVMQKSIVPHYKKDGSKWVQHGTKTKTVALTGMHVVGTVKDHPEMIWATYEHMDNAPNAEYAYLTKESKVSTASDLTSDGSAKKWLFSNTSTKPFNVEKACLKSDGTITAYKGTATDFSCNSTDGSLEKIGSSNVVRTSPWGSLTVTKSGTPQTTDAAVKNNTRLISLNRSVQNAIKSNNQYDPRQYYFLSGAVWGNPNDIPYFPANGSLSPEQLVGTALISNSTMETFHQATNKNHQVSDYGCFSCHAANLVKVDEAVMSEGSVPVADVEVINGVSVSHLFGNLDPNVPKPSK